MYFKLASADSANFAGGWEYEFRKTPPDQDDLNALAGDVENLGLNDPGPDDAEPDQPSCKPRYLPNWQWSTLTKS